MAGDDIVTQVALAGQADVIAGFAAIAAAGTVAFRAITDAASNISVGSFAEGIAGIGLAFAGATAGVFEFTRATSELVAVQSRLAQAEGTSVENISSFTAALSGTGATIDGLTVAMRRFANRVELDWPTIQKSVRGAADLITKDILGISKAQLDYEKSTTNLSEAQVNARFVWDETSQQIKKDGLSIAAASLQLDQALNALDDASRGHAPSASEQRQRAAQAAGLAAAQAQQALEDAIIKKQKDEELQLIRVKQAHEAVQAAALQRQQAELAISEAQRKQAEDQANSIENLNKFVKDTIAGIDTSKQQVERSAQNVIKGLVAETAGAAASMRSFTGTIGDFTTASPRMFQALTNLADLFHNLRDETLKQSVATELFGRGFSQSLVEALEQGSGPLRALQAQLQELGFFFDNIDEKIEKDFRGALGTLGAEVRILGGQMALAFGPGFANLLNALSEALGKNRQLFEDWAKSIAGTILPVVYGLIAAITGLDLAAKALGQGQLSPEQALKAQEWQATFTKIKEGAVELSAAVAKAFGVISSIVVGVVLPALNAIATGINNIFGTKLSGKDLGILLLIGQFTGLNNSIIAIGIGLTALATTVIPGVVAAIGRVAGALTALAFANPFLALLVAVALFGTSLGILLAKAQVPQRAWQWITDRWTEIATFVQEKVAAVKQFVDNLVTDADQAAGDAWGWIKQKWDDITSFVGQKVQAVKDIVNQIGQGAVDAWQWLVDQFNQKVESIKSAAAALPGQIKDALAGAAGGMWDWLVQSFNDAWNKIKQLAGSLFGSGDTSSSGGRADATAPAGGGFASGGFVQGAGGPTSDSILAWLSNGEYVIKAEQVAKWGLGWMHFINNGGPDKMFGRFARGGPVTIPRIPAFANGGGVSITSAIPASSSDAGPRKVFDLKLPGMDLRGLTAPASVVRSLEIASAQQQTSAAGFAPRWSR